MFFLGYYFKIVNIEIIVIIFCLCIYFMNEEYKIGRNVDL